MGSQTTTTNDRSRTYWTPTMERYFIDLMLEQMHRGTRIGHTFNKQAWTDMLTVFNAKFGSQYDKDVLKSRYTNLWKQFNDVKNLLGQSGFSWDEARQMVVADDYVWDAYIKAYPDARFYKTKAVLNFSDLCLIYGYTTADGRYSLSSHDIDIDDEVHGINIGDGMGSLASQSNERLRTDWTTAMDQYFIELMLDQVGKGNKTLSTFNKQAWTEMLTLFNAKFGPQHGKRVLRHRYKKLRKYYSDVTFLLKQDGFSWDETQRMIVADDNVWDAYTKAHPHARTYKTKALPNYCDLTLIFGNDIDNGISSQTHQEKNLEDDISLIKPYERKGAQTSTVGDRTRTYWTPPMDRYLIDLLLDQVHRGNKLGQTFICQAWIDMVTAFNAQFRSCHDKDVLKNRYKHLKRQYNDIKILLEHSGFSWDETREMISAEDYVWDAYTKDHPDARSYRVKTVPGYHKLCVIFGEESSDGRYSRLARNADHMNDLPVLMSGEDKIDRYPASIVPLSIDWTPQMDCYFIDLMLEQTHEGNKVDHTFNEQAWTQMLVLFNQTFGLQCDKCFLEDRYMCLRKQYDDITNLLNIGGFAWDETQQMVTADDEVWEACIKEYPEAISYKNTCLSNYSDLCKICQNGVLDERLCGQVAEIATCQDVVVETGDEAVEIEMDGTSGYLELSAEDFHITHQQKRGPTEVLSDLRHSRKAHKTDNNMQKALSEMAGMVTEFINKKENKNFKPIEGAIDALQAIPDIDDELLLDACDLLEDERKAKTFLALDVTLRKKWLLRKLRS
ncbi:L10-interacting MYB domain-containing protein isoform X1 [Ziziphus jujuba]|uniref:L10-interacting MYB domain-containing protein isoform X1 n=1 Tax=Ziziphus jujuba TaxID=326968 RepID=A0ABM3IN72_ZIZJJ|nr:L10-interacting MYB domain-containing protein isoform X1 [Ziziphus jujuba]XP_048332024.1 L10-interacting MYB domain-containing protein isoform X1 [Ziziphus jujuba]XP_048332025.1 L10-interacting MYB domain-containing protein isoform X1 [Ziziphus jujuba]